MKNKTRSSDLFFIIMDAGYGDKWQALRHAGGLLCFIDLAGGCGGYIAGSAACRGVIVFY